VAFPISTTYKTGILITVTVVYLLLNSLAGTLDTWVSMFGVGNLSRKQVV